MIDHVNALVAFLVANPIYALPLVHVLSYALNEAAARVAVRWPRFAPTAEKLAAWLPAMVRSKLKIDVARASMRPPAMPLEEEAGK